MNVLPYALILHSGNAGLEFAPSQFKVTWPARHGFVIAVNKGEFQRGLDVVIDRLQPAQGMVFLDHDRNGPGLADW